MNIKSFRNKKTLNGSWKFCFSKETKKFLSIKNIENSDLVVFNATVPGNFEIDLMDNGIIDDIYFGENIEKVQDYENTQKWYFRSFEFTGNKKNLFLKFEGLDCITEIFLNGNLIFETDNMLISHEFFVGDIIKEKNEIVIHFKPVIEEAQKYDYPLYTSAFPFNYESLYIRKAPHMYGWDIFPRIISAGVFKDVYLLNYNNIIDEIHIDTMKIENNIAEMLLYFKFEHNDFNINDYEIELEAKCDDSKVKIRKNALFVAGKILFEINNPKLWWPKNKGKANLYKANVRLLKSNKIIDEIDITFGVRIVKLIRSETTSKKGDGQFLFEINSEKIFILGTNWVPADALHSRDKKRIEKMIELVNDLGCNMIRCWGGNLYEDNLFYELCDKYGIMVWQDFSFGCAIYPQDSEFIKKVEIEAIQIIKRLRSHACLVLWAGDNETDCAHSWFGRSINPNYNKLNRIVLRDLVMLHDTYKEYLPSSPYISEKGFLLGEESLPEFHLWGPRDYYKNEFYKNSNCHFASEIGYHGCPSVISIKRFISKKNLWPYTNIREWLLHCTAPMPEKDNRYNFRVQLMANQIKVLFGEIPDNLEEFSYASQVSQGEAMKFFIELFRSEKWKKTGIIWWNLIDGWPQFSDAIVDYYFTKKIAYKYIKNSQKPILVLINETHEILISNDTNNSEIVSVKIFDENNIKVFSKECKSICNQVVNVGEIAISYSEKNMFKIEYYVSDKLYKNHYLSGKPHFSLKWYKDKISNIY